MSLPAFEFHAPSTLDEVFALRRKLGAGAKLMAGGTDVLLALDAGKLSCEHIISLRKVAELKGLEFDTATGLTIRAATVLSAVASYAPVREHYGILARAIEDLATVQIRNKATMTGNICNASPCANTATPLMALAAEVCIAGPEGKRRVVAEEFITGPGQTVLTDTEVVESIRVPPPVAGQRWAFLQHSSRSKVDIGAVNVAVTLQMRQQVIEEVNIFLGSVAPTPLRARAAQDILVGQTVDAEIVARAAAAARDECSPITDLRATKAYRTHMVGVLTSRALLSATGQA